MRAVLASPFIVVSCACWTPCVAQQLPLDSLLSAHSYDITLEEGKLGGSGRDFLVEASRGAQFFAIAEEHNVRELNQLTSALFAELNRAHGFNYLALEQGSVIASWMGNRDRRGDLDAILDLARRYPLAPTFATDEELRLVADIGKLSSARTNPIWGVDQEFGILHILERLATLAPDQEALREVERLAADARAYELDRSGELHYLAQVARPQDFERLPQLFRTAPGSESRMLIEALLRTVRIYHNFALSQEGLPTGYENGREREESMKLRFMEQYRAAEEAGDSIPRVLAKLGHWHIYRGIYRANVPTFGNFLSEFSLSNGGHTFVLSTYVVDSPEEWRNSGSPIARAAGGGVYTVLDLRPLRPLAHQNRIADLSDGLKQVLFMADAALVIRGGVTGTYGAVRSREGGN